MTTVFLWSDELYSVAKSFQHDYGALLGRSRFFSACGTSVPASGFAHFYDLFVIAAAFVWEGLRRRSVDWSFLLPVVPS